MKFFKIYLDDTSLPVITPGFPVNCVSNRLYPYILDDELLPDYGVDSAIVNPEKMTIANGFVNQSVHEIQPDYDPDSNRVCVLIQVRMTQSKDPWIVDSPRFEPLVMGGKGFNKSLIFYLSPSQHIFLEFQKERYIVYCKFEEETSSLNFNCQKVARNSDGYRNIRRLSRKRSLLRFIFSWGRRKTEFAH